MPRILTPSGDKYCDASYERIGRMLRFNQIVKLPGGRAYRLVEMEGNLPLRGDTKISTNYSLRACLGGSQNYVEPDGFHGFKHKEIDSVDHGLFMGYKAFLSDDAAIWSNLKRKVCRMIAKHSGKGS